MTEKEFQVFMNETISNGYTTEIVRVRKMPKRAQRRICREIHTPLKYLMAHEAKANKLDARVLEGFITTELLKGKINSVAQHATLC